MGIGGFFSYGKSKIKRGPFKLPQPAYTEDPSIAGVRERGVGADEAAYAALKRYMSGEAPSWDEQALFYDPIAQQSQAEETAGLRRINQAGAAEGSYRSGGAVRGRAQIAEAGAAQRTQGRLQAMREALAQRLSQLQAGVGYANARLGMAQQSTAGRNAYNMALNQIELQHWLGGGKRVGWNAGIQAGFGGLGGGSGTGDIMGGGGGGGQSGFDYEYQ